MKKTGYFQDKRAIIIGGSEGIGLAIALDLASLKSHVIIASRHPDKLENARQELEKRRTHQDQLLASAVLDVIQEEATTRQMESLITRYGVPDILINSAGYAHPGYLEELEVDVLKRMMEVNYTGTVRTVKAVLPWMRKAGKGHIVNISSMAGYLGLFGYTGYCASKYAVIGFSEALRQEVKPYGIHVSVVCPPNTVTPGFQRENRLKPKELLAMEETVETATPEMVSRAILHALPRGTFLIHPTISSQLVYHANRHLPRSLMDLFLKRPFAL